VAHCRKSVVLRRGRGTGAEPGGGPLIPARPTPGSVTADARIARGWLAGARDVDVALLARRRHVA